MSRGILLMMTGEQNIDYEQLAQDALRSIVRRVLTQAAKSGLPGQHHFYISFNTGAPGVIVSPRLKERYPEEMTIVIQHRFWDLMVNEERFEVKLTFDAIPERLVVPFAAVKVFFDPSVPYGLQFEGSDLAADTTQDLEAEPGDVFTTIPVAEPGPSTGPSRNDAPAGRPRAEKKPRAPRKRPGKDGVGEVAKLRGASPASADAAAEGKRPDSKPVAKPGTKPEQPEPAADNDTKVVQLDKFRKK